MAYTYEQVFAADPSNPSNVAQNASVTIFEPGDSSMTPLTITDPDGQPLANPIPVNANGFGSAFAHATLDRVAWAGGGFTGFFTSYEGMKGEAVAARAAAETAGAEAATAAIAEIDARIHAGEFKGEPGADGAPGTPGVNGANVLPTQEAIQTALTTPGPAKTALDAAVGEQAAERADFVAVAQERTPYKRLTVKRLMHRGYDDALEVTCHADDAGAHRIAYYISGGPRYRFVGDVREFGPEHAVTYTPIASDTATDYGAGDIHLYKGEATTAGAGWNTASTYYTTTVGATFTASITTTTPNAKVYITTFRDNRGGIWNFDLVEAPAVTGSLSTWAATGAYSYGREALTVPTPGTYTFRGTFAGNDPLNAPSGGISRGWLVNATTNTFYLLRVSEAVAGYAALSDGASNKNWAFRVQNPSAGVEEFIPYHGTEVETIVEPAKFYNGTAEINVAAMTVNQEIEVDSFTVIQHIKGHTSAAATELMEVWTMDTFRPDGTYRAEGTVKVLSNLLATDAMYTGMLPVHPAYLDTVVTSYRNAYPATAAMGDGRTTKLPGAEGLYTKTVAAVGPDTGHIAAVRFNDPVSTRRLGNNANLTDATYPPIFIEHRNATLTKVYPRFGYLDGTTVTTGTVWRFNVDFWFGRVPGIKTLVTV